MAKKSKGLGFITHQVRNGKKYYTGWISLGLKPDGKPNKKTKSSYSLQKVRDWLKEYNNEAFTPESQKKLIDVVTDYIETYKIPPYVDQTTYENYKAKIRIHLSTNPIADIPVNKLTSLMLSNYQKKLINEKGTSINSFVMQLIKSTLVKLRDSGEISSNPMSEITIPKHKRKPRKALTKKEQELVLKELDLDDSRDFAIFLGLTHGLRLGEICGLKWSDIKDGKMQVTEQFARIEKGHYGMKSLKTDSSYRQIPIANNILPLIESRRKQGFIFSDDNGKTPFDRKKIQRRYKQICENNRINSTFHCTRHTFTTNLAEAEVSPFILQRLLGHGKIETTLNYTHISQKAIENTMNKTTIDTKYLK